MTLKTYEICIEKDVDITNAQVIIKLHNDDWEICMIDNLNPTVITFFKWLTVECEDIKQYETIINSIDKSLRIVTIK